MLEQIKRRLQTKKRQKNPPGQTAFAPTNPQHLSGELTDMLIHIRRLFDNSGDLVCREIQIDGLNIAVLQCESMVNGERLNRAFILPATGLTFGANPAQEFSNWLQSEMVASTDQAVVHTYEDLFTFIMSGFVAVLVQGLNYGFALGMQGYAYRSVSEPNYEVNERASREGFVEPIKINMTMIRRRLKTPKLVFEMLKVGRVSHTDVCMCYQTDQVSRRTLEQVRRKLKTIDLDVVLESGYIQPFLEDGDSILFSSVGVTERPDTVCAKVSEGRIAVLVDGTPFALIVPYLFVENFQNFDDYSKRSYFGTFIRWIKYASFLFSVFLPGLYVAVATFHPKLLPPVLLFKIAAAEETTPFSLMLEALCIHFIFEIMREAGLRLPRPVGHAVSIVGGLVIGDAAVTAGIIGAPMVMILALTAISSFVVPSLYEASMVLRFAFIVLGGLMGLYGIALGSMIVLVHMCAQTSYGIPFLAPITPFSKWDMRDVLVRRDWKHLGKKTIQVQNMPGSSQTSEGKE